MIETLGEELARIFDDVEVGVGGPELADARLAQDREAAISPLGQVLSFRPGRGGARSAWNAGAVIGTCPCGSVLTKPASGPDPTYCSARCRHLANAPAEAARRAQRAVTGSTIDIACRRCGTIFVHLRGRTRTPVFCPRHRGRRNRSWAAERSCVVCAATFWPARANAKRCPVHRRTRMEAHR